MKQNINITIFQAPYVALEETGMWKKLYDFTIGRLHVPAEYYLPVFKGFIKLPDDIQEDGTAPISYILEEIFRIFNVAPPQGYCGRGMSPGDVVKVEGKFYLCKPAGFGKCAFNSSKVNIAPPKPEETGLEKIKRAEQVLIDNGINPDETQTILQALGYVLLDADLYPR